MEKKLFDWVILIMAVFFLFYYITYISKSPLIVLNFGDKVDVQYVAEEAFFKGQQTAVKGDVRIPYNPNDSNWYWIKSPWDNSDRQTKFIPKK